ncbi:hypothetical protein [Roseibium sp.]|uniref:hypothetical protein n=1 Tax=Roseibium sp. TaxID=1936156 RepID=UPI003A976A48
MSIKIDKLPYPDSFDALMSTSDLNEVFEGFAKKIPQIFNMLTFLVERPNASEIDAQYLVTGARHAVKVDARVKAKADAARAAGSEKNGGGWDEVRDMMVAQFHKEFDRKVIPHFYKTKEFQAYHKRKLVEEAKSNLGNAPAIARNLGIKDVKLLKSVMLAVALGEMAQATTLAKKMVKAEKLDLDVAGLLKDLRGGKAPKGEKAVQQKINITPATLTNCGFADPKNKVIHKWLGILVEAMNDNDRVLFQSACSKVQKEEPKDSTIAKMNSKAFLQMLFKAKVITKG